MATAQPFVTSQPTATLREAFDAQRKAFMVEPYPGAAQRIDRLNRLERVLREHESAIRVAISTDFGNRALEETRAFEEFSSLEGIRHSRRHLKRWMKPESRRAAWWSLPGRARIIRQPLGVTGIIVPWNYPLFLAVSPLTAVLAAGNRAMIKMSEFTPRFSELFRRIIADAFSADEVLVVTGGVEVAQDFSSLPFDAMVFTGSTQVGRMVMRAASEHLTPVTLELGGKSPTIVGQGFPLEEAARRIMFGKLINAGQTCVAPDYVLVPRAQQDEFIAACRRATLSYYPKLLGNTQYTSIVNDRQYARLAGCLEDAKSKGASVHPLHSDASEPASRYMAPAALTGISAGMRVAEEEIFGPLLPIIPYDDFNEVIRHVNERPRPLALYYFGSDAGERARVLTGTISGGVTINNVAFHVLQEDLPFGGVGPSGMGHYHGEAGFDSFSKLKPVFYDGRLSGSFLLRPPYGAAFKALMRILHR